jgi:hypothetical protein
MKVALLVVVWLLVAVTDGTLTRWNGEKTLSAWLVGSVAVAVDVAELEERRVFVVTYNVSGDVALAGRFAEHDVLDVRFNQSQPQGFWIELKRESECRTVATTGQFVSLSVEGKRRRMDLTKYCASKLAPSHMEVKFESCELQVRLWYAAMWHTVHLTRDPPCTIATREEQEEAEDSEEL